MMLGAKAKECQAGPVDVVVSTASDCRRIQLFSTPRAGTGRDMEAAISIEIQFQMFKN